MFYAWQTIKYTSSGIITLEILEIFGYIQKAKVVKYYDSADIKKHKLFRSAYFAFLLNKICKDPKDQTARFFSSLYGKI